jgi:hypothetical protein
VEDSGNSHANEPLTLPTEPTNFLACLTTYLESPQKSTAAPKSFLSIKPVWGEPGKQTGGPIHRTFMAEVTDRMRDIWILDAEMETVGLKPRISEMSSEDSQWRIETNLPDVQKLWNKLQMNPVISTEWVIAPKADHLMNSCKGILQKIVGTLSQRGLRATIMCFRSPVLLNIAKHGLNLYTTSDKIGSHTQLYSIIAKREEL